MGLGKIWCNYSELSLSVEQRSISEVTIEKCKTDIHKNAINFVPLFLDSDTEHGKCIGMVPQGRWKGKIEILCHFINSKSY